MEHDGFIDKWKHNPRRNVRGFNFKDAARLDEDELIWLGLIHPASSEIRNHKLRWPFDRIDNWLRWRFIRRCIQERRKLRSDALGLVTRQELRLWQLRYGLVRRLLHCCHISADPVTPDRMHA